MKVKRILVFLIGLVGVNAQTSIQSGYLPPESSTNNNPDPSYGHSSGSPITSGSQVPLARWTPQNPSNIDGASAYQDNPSSFYNFPPGNEVYAPNADDNDERFNPTIYSNLSPLLNPPTGNSADNEIPSPDSIYNSNTSSFNGQIQPSYIQPGFNQPQFGHFASYPSAHGNLNSQGFSSPFYANPNVPNLNSGRQEGSSNSFPPIFSLANLQGTSGTFNDNINNNDENRIPSLFSPSLNTLNRDDFANVPVGFDSTSRRPSSTYGLSSAADDLKNINPSSTTPSSAASSSSPSSTSFPESKIFPLSPQSVTTISPVTTFPNSISSSTPPPSNIVVSTTPNSINNGASSYPTDVTDSNTPIKIGGSARRPPSLTNGIADYNSNGNAQDKPAATNFPVDSFGSRNANGLTPSSVIRGINSRPNDNVGLPQSGFNNLIAGDDSPVEYSTINNLASSGPNNFGTADSDRTYSDIDPNNEFLTQTNSNRNYPESSGGSSGNSPRLQRPIVVDNANGQALSGLDSNSKFSGLNTGNKYAGLEGTAGGNLPTKYNPNNEENTIANNDIDDQAGSAQYEFNYDVNDGVGNEFGHQESRNGNSARGSYKVVLPDGRKQVVDYVADEKGYRPRIRYEDANGAAINGLNNANGANNFNSGLNENSQQNGGFNNIGNNNNNNNNAANHGNVTPGQFLNNANIDEGIDGIGTGQPSSSNQGVGSIINNNSGQHSGYPINGVNYPNSGISANNNNNNYPSTPNENYENEYSNVHINFPHVNNVDSSQANQPNNYASNFNVNNVDNNALSGTNDNPGTNYPSDISNNGPYYSGQNNGGNNYPSNNRYPSSNGNQIGYQTDSAGNGYPTTDFGAANGPTGSIASNFPGTAINNGYDDNQPLDVQQQLLNHGGGNGQQSPNYSNGNNNGYSGASYDVANSFNNFNGSPLNNNVNLQQGNPSAVNPSSFGQNNQPSYDDREGSSNLDSNRGAGSFNEQDGYKYKRATAKRL